MANQPASDPDSINNAPLPGRMVDNNPDEDPENQDHDPWKYKHLLSFGRHYNSWSTVLFINMAKMAAAFAGCGVS